MKKDIVIYGASGLGREILYLIKSRLSDDFNVIAFIDDGLSKKQNMTVSDLPVYSIEFLHNYKSDLGVVIAIADSKIKKKLYENLVFLSHLFFPSIVSPSSSIALDAFIGEGSIIISSSISVSAKIGKFVLMNGAVFIGHDVLVGDNVSIMPRCSISGNVKIENNVSIGAHSFVIQGKKIGENSIVAPGSIVFTNVPANVTVMGNPATILVRHNDHKNKNC